MKKLEQIPNPFPSLGTPASIGLKIKPIGYNKGIDRIHYTIRHNTGHQAIIFNIVGDFGYGKTLFLNYLFGRYPKERTGRAFRSNLFLVPQKRISTAIPNAKFITMLFILVLLFQYLNQSNLQSF